MTDTPDFRSTVSSIEEEYDSDIFFYSREIDDEGLGALVRAVTDSKSRDNALLILVTNGGSANAAYRIARFFQKTYSNGEFTLFVPGYCKSAGTLIALGAHKLIMDTFSELGPLDVQLLKQDEIGTRKSGLLSKFSFLSLQEASFDLFEHLMLEIKKRSYDQISFRLAAEVSSKMTGELLSGVYGQISPDVVGSDYRDLQVALHYGIRLAEASGNATPGTVTHLVENYPSHDFVIDNEEAAALFNNVAFPSGNLYSLISLLGDVAYNEDRSGVVLALSKQQAKAEGSDHANGDNSESVEVRDDGDAESAGVAEGGEQDRPSNSETSRASEPGSDPRQADQTGDDRAEDKDALN